MFAKRVAAACHGVLRRGIHAPPWSTRFLYLSPGDGRHDH